ncbi:MAG: hypothetical protein SFX73_27835 [Kofleriaceae bacterium]|nr:hypothetical protein [Kofleriaceae bacterium]
MLAVAACGGGVAVEDLPVELEDAQCAYLVRCNLIADSSTCHDVYDIGDNSYQTLLNGVDDGTIAYDEEAAEECRDYFADQDCQFEGFTGGDNPCEDVFTGTVPVGGACEIDLQCANDGDCVAADPMCDPDTTCCPGICEASSEMISQMGGACNDDIHVCADNLWCQADSNAPGTCQPLVIGEGSTCQDLFSCAAPLYCNIDFFDPDAVGTCERPSPSGAACNPDDLVPCADDRDYCDPAGMTCIRARLPGEVCGDGIGCVGYASCLNGMCVAEGVIGSPCGDNTAECTGPLECINGTCQAEPDGLVCLQ